MDRLEPFKTHMLDKIDFNPNRYEVYQNGMMIDSGRTSMKIHAYAKNPASMSNDNICINIQDNDLERLLNSISSLDIVVTLMDRYISLILPRNSNIKDVMYERFPLMFDYTRDYKQFSDKEPLCMSIFTENGNIVKMSFKVYIRFMETLIELYI